MSSFDKVIDRNELDAMNFFLYNSYFLSFFYSQKAILWGKNVFPSFQGLAWLYAIIGSPKIKCNTTNGIYLESIENIWSLFPQWGIIKEFVYAV